MNYLVNHAIKLLREVIENLEMPAAEFAEKINCKEEEEGSSFRLDGDTVWQYRSGYAKGTVKIALHCLEQLARDYEISERTEK